MSQPSGCRLPCYVPLFEAEHRAVQGASLCVLAREKMDPGEAAIVCSVAAGGIPNVFPRVGGFANIHCKVYTNCTTIFIPAIFVLFHGYLYLLNPQQSLYTYVHRATRVSPRSEQSRPLFYRPAAHRRRKHDEGVRAPPQSLHHHAHQRRVVLDVVHNVRGEDHLRHAQRVLRAPF